MIPRVLIVEKDSSEAAAIRQVVEGRHCWVVVVGDRESALDLLKRQLFHLCLWPVEGREQAEEILRIRQLRPGTAVIATGHSSDPSLIVLSIRCGGSHYWHRPQGLDALAGIVEETLARTLPIEEMTETDDFPFPDLVGRHPKIREIFKLIQLIKDTDSTILITGESGTGKELVARAVHSLSQRRRQPWIAVNCSAIPVNLLESELFGHVKGAFTGASQNRMGRFQLAGSGTLFLDEIGELSFDLQAKLLRALQNRVFEPVGGTHSVTLDARIIAATNQDLDRAVKERRFREDLYYRLNVIPIYIPPLRSRKSDIPLLVSRFLERCNKTARKQVPGISEEAMHALMQYHWPGNIRELENLVERAVVLKESDTIVELRDFPVGYFRDVKLDRFVANVSFPEDGLNFTDAVNDFENELILQALRRTDGNKNQAANLLRLNRTTLVEKLKRKGLRINS